MSGYPMSNTIPHNPNHYETVYGFSVLDELHNFMPEFLYDDTIFQNEMLAYMRHRVRNLFHDTYIRQQHMYTIYSAQQRRSSFLEWQRLRQQQRQPQRQAPVTNARAPMTAEEMINAVSAALNGGAPIPGVSNIRLEVPVTDTTPLRRAAPLVDTYAAVAASATPAATGSAASTGSTASTGGQTHPRSYVGGLLPPTNRGNSAGLLQFLATGLFADMDNVIQTNIQTTGGRAFWQDVEVAATDREIAAGSTVVEQATIPSDVNCAICQEHTYADGDSSYHWRQLHCSHKFHKECIDEWFGQSVHCPVCRADIRDVPQTASPAQAHPPSPGSNTP